VAIAALSALTSWWVARQAMQPMAPGPASTASDAAAAESTPTGSTPTRAELGAEAGVLLRCGLARLGSGLLSVLIEFGAFRKLRKSGPLELEFGAIVLGKNVHAISDTF
jgi:hypothetical protein